MNKLVLLFCLLAIGLFIGDAFALNAPAMQGGNPDNWYIEVEYNQGALTGAAIRAGHGDLMEWDLDSDEGETLGYTVHKMDADTTGGVENAAGFIPSNADTSHNLDSLNRAVRDGDVFLIQIRGYHSAVSCDGNVTAGQGIESKGGTSDGMAGDGEGLGFAFKDDADDSSTANTAEGQYFAPVWIDIDNQQ